MSEHVFSDGVEILAGPFEDGGGWQNFLVRIGSRVAFRIVSNAGKVYEERNGMEHKPGVTYGPREIDYKAALEKIAKVVTLYPESDSVFLIDVRTVVDALREAGLLDDNGSYIGNSDD